MGQEALGGGFRHVGRVGGLIMGNEKVPHVHYLGGLGKCYVGVPHLHKGLGVGKAS